jgi:hypothetical protein
MSAKCFVASKPGRVNQSAATLVNMNTSPGKLRGIEDRRVSLAECRVGRGALRRNPPIRTMGFTNVQPILPLIRSAASCGELNRKD